MDYKKIFRSQKLRFAILRLLAFVPDSVMLRIQYRIKMGVRLNLRHPQRFTEKLQWYKINHRDPLMGICVDKYEVRKYVASKGLEGTLNKLYCVCKDPDEIDFASLPDKFVVKTTDGGGGENIFICKDKGSLDIPELKRKLKAWKNKKNINAGREWAYTCIKESRYIVEEYLENEVNPEAGISDYKFFCFNGRPYCIAYDIDRYIGHKRNFYDVDWNNLNVSSDCDSFDDGLVVRPEGLEDMVRVAEILSKDFPFVRVDLYHIRNQVYFGELTFYPWSGYVKFNPVDFDFRLGELMTYKI